jgi:hypothetical protein
MKRQDILFNPSDAHAELRDNVARFAKQELGENFCAFCV